MKRSKTASTLFKSGLAMVLAVGLMLPTTGPYAYGDEIQTRDQAALESEPVTVDASDNETWTANSFKQVVADIREIPTDEDGSSKTIGNTAITVAGLTRLEEAPLYRAIAQGSLDVHDETTDNLPQEAIASVEALGNTRAADYTVGGLTVSGGEKDVDFVDTGSTLRVLTSAPLTFKGTSTTYGIQIGEGVQADITLAGVSITRSIPFELLRNTNTSGDTTYCYLTLADGTVNVLNASGQTSPGLRCGLNCTLVIDDSIANIKAGGSRLDPSTIITPENGLIGFDGTTLDGIAVTAESDLSLLESKNPGVLKCAAGAYSAAIGGGGAENGGTMIFNGGTIIAAGSNSGAAVTNDNYNWQTYWTAEQGTQHGGAGIGGGCMGSGTIIIINGGNITAKASYHGSGIGGGYCNGTGNNQGYYKAAYNNRNPNAIANTQAEISFKSVAGDITINGGYVKSYSSGHGNAFGQACCGTNTGKTITVTGGTLLPWSNDGYFDIGGAGGNVVITGGSIRLTGAKSGEAYTGDKFQSSDNKAYNALPDTEDRVQVFMFCIDLARSDGIGTEPVASWDLLIGGVPYEYGAPSYFDDGKLYLWLPTTAVGKKITVRVKKYDENGELKDIEDLDATPSDSSGSGLGKRWISYKLTADFLAENDELFTKYYDGASIQNLINSLETYVDTKGLPAPYGANPDAVLSDPLELKYQSAKLDDNGDPLEEYYPAQASHDHSILPEQSGVINVKVESNEFAKPGTTTAESFWGHSTDFNVTINPVNSKTSFVPYTLKGENGAPDVNLEGPTWMQDENGDLNHAQANHLIVPVDITSFTYPNGDTVDGSNMSKPTCKAPIGQIQLFLDGEPISASHGGVMTFTREDLEDGTVEELSIVKDAEGREHTLALFDFSRAQLEAHGLKTTEGDIHTVTATYTSRTDATPARTAAALDDAQPLSVYRNYYDSMTEETLVQIQKSPCTFEVYNEKGTGYSPDDAASAPTLDEAHRAQEVFYDIADFTGTNPSTFPLYIDTNSMGAVTLTSSNPNVLTIAPSKVPHRGDRFQEGSDSEDFGFGTTATVHAAGKTTITAKIESTGAFKDATYSFDVYIYPDPSAKPVIAVTETAYNLTRNDGSIRPYDTLRYTATYTNETANSSFQNPVFTLSVPRDTSFVSLDVIDPEGNRRTLKAGADFTHTSGVGRALAVPFNAVGLPPSLQASTDVLTIASLPALFGNQSYRFVMDVTVNPSVVAKEADAMDFYSQTTANGVYGIDPVHDATYPWDTRFPAGGTPTDEVWDFADPTSEEPDGPKKPTIEDIIGGGLIDPAPVNPDDPNTPQPKPGVEVGDVIPDGPLDTAEKPDPDNPDDPDKRTPAPIKPGDRIVSFGDVDDPTTPDEVKDEIKEQIRKKLEEDPTATEVEVPVVIERPNPAADPDDPTIPDVIREEVIVTFPIPQDFDPNDPSPDDRDDHELIVIPADPTVNPDPDNGEAPDIVLAKIAENITPGHEDRGNQSVALVGDTIRYTVTVSNMRVGTAWYNAVVRDLIPAGMAYVSGSVIITDAQGVEHRDFDADFADGTSDVAFYLGDIPGGTSAVVSFECTVLPELLGAERPVNVAHASGTMPSDTIDPADPNDPDGPVKQDRDPQPPGPVDPNTPGVWPEGTPLPATPETPIDDVVPGNPSHDKLLTQKSSVNLTEHEDNAVYVGDTLRYTITFQNTDEPWTAWFDVVLQDKLPAGLAPIPGTIRLTGTDGAETTCPDDVYDAEAHEVVVFAGVVFGGQSITLVMDVEVTEAALKSDIGNIAFAYGTDPSETENSVLGGKPSGTPGTGFPNIRDLEEAAKDDERLVSPSETSYPAGYDGSVHPSPKGGSGNGDDAGAGSALTSLKKLAKTGDLAAFSLVFCLEALALSALVFGICLVVRRRRHS